MLNKKANEARKSIIKMIYEAKSGHPGGSLSCIDILMYLYQKELKLTKIILILMKEISWYYLKVMGHQLYMLY